MSDRTTRANTSDLGGRDHLTAPIRWTAAERFEYETLAAQAVEEAIADDAQARLEVLQMLGLAPYTPKRRARVRKPVTEHGKRAGYTNGGCGRGDSPPCPASPTCAEVNSAYYAEYRQTHERTAA